MAEEPTIHDVLSGTLAHRAEALGEVVPTSLDGVARRVDQRRARRRRVAAGGSLAVVAAGGVGLLLLPGGGSEPAPGAGSPAATFYPPFNVWRCVGDLGEADADEDGRYFSSCAPITIPPELNVESAIPDGSAAPPPAATAAPQPLGEQLYTVAAGDSIFSIAEQYGVEMQVLANYNRWEDGLDHVLDIGDVVKIPPGVATDVTTGQPSTIPAGG